MTQELTNDDRKVMEKIQKLLDKAASTTFDEERTSLQAKAQELMTQYNLDAALIERETGKEGKREELKTRGGFYQYQRDLWQAVAELNFCLYWTQLHYVPQFKHLIERGMSERRPQKRHRLIGRVVNTTATKVMASYLEQCIERSVRETLNIPSSKQFSTEAHSFRKGVTEELIDKISARYKAQLSKEAAAKARAAAQQGSAASATASTSTAISLVDYEQSEEDANQDFIHGAGYSARQRAEAAEYARHRAEERAAHTTWAKAHPEEARAQEEAGQKEADAYWRRRRGGRSGGRADNTDWSAYRRGREAGKSISIDQQVDANRAPAGAPRLT